MSDFVDLRSDTVTTPSPAMRRAMAEAVVGDDGSGEDPTVNELEAEFAHLLGKEAALFVPSGTMGNQLALRLLGAPGTSVVVGRRQHIVTFENGAAALNAPVQFHLVDDTLGVVEASDVRFAIEASEHHWLRASAVFVENTHMPANGAPWSIDDLDAVANLGLPVHMDGARLFNAVVATGITAKAYAARATTVMCCLSKGLGAPVGSLLAASSDLISRARGERKRFGGGMRQAGVLAAPGLVALRGNIARLVDDHDKARVLADAVADRWPGALDPTRVLTNIVVFPHQNPAALLEHLETEGVRAGTLAPGVVRFVTHLDVDGPGIERARSAIASAP
jgi:threonine aldolase